MPHEEPKADKEAERRCLTGDSTVADCLGEYSVYLDAAHKSKHTIENFTSDIGKLAEAFLVRPYPSFL